MTSYRIWIALVMLEVAQVIDVGWYLLLALVVVFGEYSFNEVLKKEREDKENKENSNTLH